jgi:hypothetical protein
MPNSQLSLTEVHRDAIKAANSSWSETDKLYVSVCSALVALATIFGWGRPGSEMSMIIVGILLLLLAGNWMRLIRRYREEILDSLKALSKAQDDPEMREYFDNGQNRVRNDWGDYFIAVVVLLMSLSMIAAGGLSVCLAHRASI